MTEALLNHADAVAAQQLGRVRGRLGRLSPEQWDAVEELAGTLAEAVAHILEEEAGRSAALADALAEVYS